MDNGLWQAARWRFPALFAGGGALIMLWGMAESTFIKRLTFAFQLEFAIPVTIAFIAGLVVVLCLHAWLRLAGIRRRLEAAAAEPAGSAAVGHSLLKLPAELFWWTVGYAVLAIPIYHIVHYVAYGRSLLNIDPFFRDNFIRSFLYEWAVGLSAAILHYTVARRLIRPFLIPASPVRGERLPDRSFLSLLATTFGVLLTINLLSVLWYVQVAEIEAKPVEWRVLLPLVAFELVFAAVIFHLLAREFRRELQLLAVRLRIVPQGERARAQLPVLAGDEVGQLAVAFNRLQERIERDYDEVAGELRLARDLQRQLLPPAQQRLGGCAVAALSLPRHEVGSGFYDIIPLAGGTFAAIAGEARGAGMPAALQMSALLLLLRAEAHGAGTPAQILDRFARVLREVYPQEAGLSVCLTIVDGNGERMQTALRGNMRGRIWSGAGEGRELRDGDDAPFRPGDRIVLFSAAAAHAVRLDRSEAQLAALRADAPLAEQLAADGGRPAEQLQADDDLTLLLVVRLPDGEEAA
ncbi:PP2C family protein-serine/threonine phosphatase [Paenibacillus cymbidii]|uniref:PP2C family protein-serine/threonine phosphatase n=1 Tax=Paenibacillus cymbidii TaxID=1639034 RepID=UPI0010813B6B|nr:SpoIIE family protein phosphatase [Paenibacillus cymbidii]